MRDRLIPRLTVIFVLILSRVRLRAMTKSCAMGVMWPRTRLARANSTLLIWAIMTSGSVLDAKTSTIST